MNFFGLDMSASFHQQAESNFQLLFQDALEKLTKKGFHVLINIDEVHLTPLLKKFASCYQIMIRNNLNVSLLMAGLFQKSKMMMFLPFYCVPIESF